MTTPKRWLAIDDLSELPKTKRYRVFQQTSNCNRTLTYPGINNSYSAEQAIWTLKKLHNKTGDVKMQYIEMVKGGG